MATAVDRSATPKRWRVPVWVGDVIAAALVVSLAVVPYPAPEYRPSGPLAIAVALIPAAVLPFRRRWPLPVLGLCIALYGVVALTGTLAPGIALATAIAMFGVAVRTNRRTTIVAGAITTVAIMGLSLLAAIGSVFDPRTIQLAVTMAFAAAAGDATRSRREYIQAITDRAIRAEETRESEAKRRVTEERLRIARDLHDAVAHQISVISLNAGVASTALESRPEAAKAALSTIRTAAREVLGEIGDLLEVLRAEDGDATTDGGAAPQPGLERLDELLARFREGGLEVTLRIDGDLAYLPVAADLVAYRVIQEALTNALKHGSPHRAHVFISVGADVARLVVTNPVVPSADDGTSTGQLRGGHGLIGLRERVASVRGTVEAGPAPGGYRVVAQLPLAKAEPR